MTSTTNLLLSKKPAIVRHLTSSVVCVKKVEELKSIIHICLVTIY